MSPEARKVNFMKEKSSKTPVKTDAKSASIRVSLTAKKNAKEILKTVNKKGYGRNVRLSELLELAMTLIQPAHIQMLQEKSLSSDDRKEQMRQKYIATRGPISKAEFTDFQMTAAYIDFLSEQIPTEVVELNM